MKKLIIIGSILGICIALEGCSSVESNSTNKFNNSDRFKIIYSQTSKDTSYDCIQIIKDTKTGKEYLCREEQYGVGLTPLQQK